MKHMATFDQRLNCYPKRSSKTHLKIVSAKLFAVYLVLTFHVDGRFNWNMKAQKTYLFLMYVAVCRILCCFYTVGTYIKSKLVLEQSSLGFDR